MSGKAPKAPDYNAAAQQTAVASQQAVNAQNVANRPTQNTPWGNSQWIQGPDGQWTQNVSLDPQDQQSLDSQQQIGADKSKFAQGMFGRVQNEMGAPVDFDKFQQYGELGDYDTRRQGAEDAAYSRASSRLDPYWQQQSSDMDIQLRNQGLVPGDEAYDRAIGNLDRAKNDAYSTARDDAMGQGRQESALAFDQELGTAGYQNTLRNQQIQDELTQRGWSLNEINSLLSGSQVGMPDMPSFEASSRAQSPDYSQAASNTYQAQLDRYNAKQANLQGIFSGITGIAKAGMGLPPIPV
jgi:hypothetical protein